MRIAFVTNNLFPPKEGIARHLMELTSALSRRGVEPIIIAPQDEFPEWHYSVVDQVEFHRYPRPVRKPFHQLQLQQILKKWSSSGADRADLLHIHMPLVPAFRSRLPKILTFHSPLLTDSAAISEKSTAALYARLSARYVSSRIEQAQINQANRLIAVSSNVAAELRTHYRLGHRKVDIMPNGINLKSFPFVGGKRDHNRILYVGRLGFRKGLQKLIKAFSRVSNRKLKLMLAGEGPLKNVLKDQVKQLGIEERVEFTGFVDQQRVRELLNRCDLFINPADYESGPITLLEAMANGTPVVSTRTGLVHDFGSDPPLWLTNNEPKILCGTIEKALRQPEFSRALAMKARRLIEQSYDWDIIADRFQSIYHERFWVRSWAA